MLGYKDDPILLVEVDNEFDSCNFKFYVINGDWYGHYTNSGIKLMSYPDDPFIYKSIQILSKDQELLSGHYEDAFDKFYKFGIH